MSSSSHDRLPIEPVWLIAFSGHRPKPTEAGRSPEEIAACRDSLRATLSSLQKTA